jgi:hypothetical protein
MRASIYVAVVALFVFGVLAAAPQATAGEERSTDVVSATVAFEAGETIPDFDHRFLKIRKLNITIGEPTEKKMKQQIKLKMRIDNFGEHDHRVIINAILLDADGKIIASKVAKNDIDDNDSEDFSIKYKLQDTDVEKIEEVRLDISHLKD